MRPQPSNLNSPAVVVLVVDGPAVARSLALPFSLATALTLTSSNPARLAPLVAAVGYQELLSHPEVTLYYPGSRVLDYVGRGEYPERCRGPLLVCTPGDFPASVDTILAVKAGASDDIFLWYQEQLSRRGWRPGSSNADELRAYLRAPRERFQLTVDPPTISHDILGGAEPLIWYSTSYSVGSCPSIDAGCRTNLRPAPGNDDRVAPPIPAGRIFVGDLMVRPEAHLYFPGSSLTTLSGTAEGRGHLFGYADPVTRADLVALNATERDVQDWYDRTLTSRGWTKVPTKSDGIEYRRGAEDMNLTFGGNEPQFGYGLSGLAYTVIYLIDTCAGHPLALCE